MESAFGKLFRTSRLASYDPQIRQVYTSYGPESRAAGTWGLKRDMPLGLRTKLVHIQALDTKEQQTDFSSAQSEVLHWRRWRQMFPSSRRPEVPRAIPVAQYTKMDRKQWKQFLRYATSRKKEWTEALVKRTNDSLQLHEFLNASHLPNKTNEHVQHGSGYYHYNATFGESAVQGRILNFTPAGLAVGVGGFVGTLMTTYGGHKGLVSREVTTLYVRRALLENPSTPQIDLAYNANTLMREKQTRNTLHNMFNHSLTRLRSNIAPRSHAGRGGPQANGSPSSEQLTDHVLDRMRPSYSKASAAGSRLDDLRQTINSKGYAQPNAYSRPRAANTTQTPFGVPSKPRK
ncbi:hypothetical protein IWQ61_001852 [Dispira simplex]|nr:hypothetical protein IWQ61_001852 [Dispira simplex]